MIAQIDTISSLCAAANAPAARREEQRLQGEADLALAQADGASRSSQAGVPDRMADGGRSKQSRKGSKTYAYWMASWREGDRRDAAGSSQKDGCSASPPEGQEDEGRGAGDKGLLIEALNSRRLLLSQIC